MLRSAVLIDAEALCDPVRRGGRILCPHEHSLALAFVFLFLMAWVGHALGGFAEYAADQHTHGQPLHVADGLPLVSAILVRIIPELAERQLSAAATADLRALGYGGNGMTFGFLAARLLLERW